MDHKAGWSVWRIMGRVGASSEGSLIVACKHGRWRKMEGTKGVIMNMIKLGMYCTSHYGKFWGAASNSEHVDSRRANLEMQLIQEMFTFRIHQREHGNHWRVELTIGLRIWFNPHQRGTIKTYVPWLIEGLQWIGMTMIRNLIMASRVPNQFPIKSYPIGSMVLVYIC